MSNIRIEVMIKYLKTSARHYDKTTFTKWENGEITTDECIKQFRLHNGITERMPILKDDFITWLAGLGYIRSN